MRQRGRVSLFWNRVMEDSNLIFFFLGFLAWIVDFMAERAGTKTAAWYWLAVSVAIPVFFTAGLTFYLIKHYRLTAQLTSTKHLPVVFVVGKPRDEAKKALALAQEAIATLTGFRAFHQIEEAFNVQCEHLMPHRSQWLGHEIAEWKDYIEDAERDIHRFTDALPGDKVYHIFVYGPASLAMGLGAAFGTKHPVVVYQRANGQYKPVINLMQDVRRIKQATSEHKYIQVSYPGSLTRELAVVLEMAGHVPEGDVVNFLKRQAPPAEPMELVKVVNTYGGNLTEEDWAGVVQELFSVFVGLKRNAEVGRFHVFHTMPVAMAFGLGMALGNFIPVTVYNWESAEATYYPVLRLNELESFL